MLPEAVKKYFWEVDVDGLDVDKNPEYIISRLLEYGDREATRWLFKKFSRALIAKTLREGRAFSPRTANFWRLYLNLDKNKVLCLRMPYQKRREGTWPY